jgi:hypothetical protein
MSVGEMNQNGEEMRRLSSLIDDALEELKRFAVDLAESENRYRHSRSKAWGMVSKTTDDGVKRLAAEIEAEVDELTADLRFARDRADYLRQVALEAVRSRRQQLSAWQSWVAAERAEAEFVRTSP